MKKFLFNWYRWLFRSNSFRIYWANVLTFRLFLLWIGKLIRWFAWVADVFVDYVKKPNILVLMLVLMIGCTLGFGYSYLRIDKRVNDCLRAEIAKGSNQCTRFSAEQYQEKELRSSDESINTPETVGRSLKDDVKDWIFAKYNYIKDWLHKSLWNNRKEGRAIKWCLRSMFDGSYAVSNLRNDGSLWSVVDGIVAVLLFLFTWLIGGGALISSIITTMHENHHGAWRKWKNLLYNHTLIIGWNANGPTIIRNHLEHSRIKLIKTPWGTWQPKRPERLIIITSGDAYEISKVIESTIGNFLQRLRVTHDVYCGSYDDVKERKRLAIGRANSIYVLGDEGEPAHDARVSLWPTLIRNEKRFWVCKLLAYLMTMAHLKRRKRHVYCGLNIESYGLFCQQQRKCINEIGGSGSLVVDINAFNFYDSWAKRLFARLDVKDGYNHVQSTSRVEVKNNGPYAPRIIIIGFTQMGQAILAELVRDCHYTSDDNVLITVLDENVGELCTDFKSIYPRIEEIPDVHVDWVGVEKLGSSEFLSIVRGLIDKDHQTTIIVAHDDPAVSVRLALPIKNKTTVGGLHPKLLIRQEVKGLYNDLRVTNNSISGGQEDFKVFGMLDGAGFGARRRDDIVKKMMCTLRGLDVRRCREKVDALGQILAGLGIEVWSCVPSPCNSNYELVFPISAEGRMLTEEDLASNVSTQELLKAFHKHWCACYLLSDDGSGIPDKESDYRLVKYDELKEDKRGITALREELLCLLNALAESDLYLVKKKGCS